LNKLKQKTELIIEKYRKLKNQKRGIIESEVKIKKGKKRIYLYDRKWLNMIENLLQLPKLTNKCIPGYYQNYGFKIIEKSLLLPKCIAILLNNAKQDFYFDKKFKIQSDSLI